jgi:hypothetical protein
VNKTGDNVNERSRPVDDKHNAKNQTDRYPGDLDRGACRTAARGDHAGTWLLGRADVDLVRAGLATAKAERVVAAGRTAVVARVRITEAGRRPLAERPPQMTKKLNAREPKYLVRARVSPPRLQIERFHRCSLPALQQ